MSSAIPGHTALESLPLRDQFLLAEARYYRELHHLERGEYTQFPARPALENRLPLARIPLEKMQGCCNKSIPLYCTGANIDWFVCARIYHYIYPRWYRGLNSEVEFGNFVAQTISLHDKDPRAFDKDQTVIDIHEDLCRQLREREGVLDEIDKAYQSSCTYTQKEQHQYYKVRALFRAILILFHNVTPWPEEGMVRLVKTGVTAGLSAPITFDSIKESCLGPYDPESTSVTTDFPTAINFALALEKREADAGNTHYERNVLDNFPGYSDAIDELNEGVRRSSRCGTPFSTPGTIRPPSNTWTTPEFLANIYKLPTSVTGMPERYDLRSVLHMATNGRGQRNDPESEDVLAKKACGHYSELESCRCVDCLKEEASIKETKRLSQLKTLNEQKRLAEK
ncbi:hypothetical protein EJ08DRAFT_678638 [Tothia fuscella]|uniref:Uncharacterized protein n=1 Tax=Tothia fuscella TaxID=1048955 RepID=A0A9P4NSY9_9PEZI|nr:hypothetical protein EJ08DRAFT_678638 [Tothia fuscella]